MYYSVCHRKVFISESCPNLILTPAHERTVALHDAKTGVKNYQGPTTSRENAIRK
jgi:hypothetical protein